MNNKSRVEQFTTLTTLAILGLISFGSFRRSVAKKIGRRDRWTCQVTGRKFKDGWLLDVAHLDHTRNENYNNPDNGLVLSRSAHLLDHITRWKQLGGEENLVPIRLLAKRNFRTGLRHFEIYRDNPELLDQDRTETVMLLRNEGFNPEDFIDFPDDEIAIDQIVSNYKARKRR